MTRASWGARCRTHRLPRPAADSSRGALSRDMLPRRMRAIAWKQWKRGRTRFARLRRRGVGRDLAAQTAGSPHGPWRLSNSPALTQALQF
jgi:hypothetical protein